MEKNVEISDPTQRLSLFMMMTEISNLDSKNKH
jgi:hypothetical protein